MTNIDPNINNINTTLFGPLGKQYCFYFYLISVFLFVVLVIYVFSGIFIGITQKKGGQYYLGMIVISTIYAMGYLQNRLLFQMCSHSL
jgi:hypothetical protein